MQAVKTLASNRLGKYKILLFVHTSETSAHMSQGMWKLQYLILAQGLEGQANGYNKQNFTCPKEQIVHKELSLDLTVLKV